MPVFRVVDDNILSEGEYRFKQEELTEFLQARAAGHKTAPLVLSDERELESLAPLRTCRRPNLAESGMVYR
jgi:hypothetical protein